MGTWCEWSGTEGINCKSDGDRGRFRLPNGTWVAEKDYNEYGYYELVVTQPILGADEVKDAEVWGFADDVISLTWTVRDLTAEEIDQRDAQPMPLSEYYLWKTLIVTGIITQQQAVNNLPAELIDAYQARDRLENP